MKKNKAMRAAGALFVATMLSTSIVSGTYAKYVTSDSASDAARVAQFGVEISATGSLFDKTYFSVENSNSNQPGGNTTEANTTDGIKVLTVESSNLDKIVAPGTKNTSGLTFTITGKPEVDVKITFNVTNSQDTAGGAGKPSDIFLGTTDNNKVFPDMTKGKVMSGDYTAVFENNTVYYPIVYTLTRKPATGTGTPEIIKNRVSLSEIEGYFEGSDFATQYFDANTDLSAQFGTYTLTWEWYYDDAAATSVTAGNNITPDANRDKKDTLLGDLAAEFALTNNYGGVSATLANTSTIGNTGIVSKAYSAIYNNTENSGKPTLQTLTRKNAPGTPSANLVNTTTTAGDYSINTDIKIEISVTQVD